jgi:hypothetical protein
MQDSARDKLDVTRASTSPENPRLPLNTVRSMPKELFDSVIAALLTPLVA